MIQNWIRLLLIASLALFMGCRVLRPTTIVKHPQAAMLITETQGNRLRVAIYDSGTNTLVEYGWIYTEGLSGWTLHNFDWEGFRDNQVIRPNEFVGSTAPLRTE